MLDAVFGNATAAKILYDLYVNRTGYANDLARRLRIPLNMVQKQLLKFAKASVLRTQKAGNRILYQFDKSWTFYRPIQNLLKEQKRYLQRLRSDPADGTYLSASERLSQSEELFKQALRLGRTVPYKPFIKSFDTFKEYDEWRKHQTHPLLV
jgi:hypothetical protein